jgi:hypothetical protein
MSENIIVRASGIMQPGGIRKEDSKPDDLTVESVQGMLEDRGLGGYTVEEEIRSRTYATFVLSKGEVNYILKVAVKPSANTNIANEAHAMARWHKQEGSSGFHRLPKIYEFGYLDNGRLFFIADMVEGGQPLLAEPSRQLEPDFEPDFSNMTPENMEAVARAYFEYMQKMGNLDTVHDMIPGSTPVIKLADGREVEVRISNSGIDQINHNLRKYRSRSTIAERYASTGDGKPWHALIVAGQDAPALIDLEHASARERIKYWDIANTFHRIATQDIEKAYEFLRAAIRVCPEEYLGDFKRNFLAGLKYRLAGGLFDSVAGVGDINRRNWRNNLRIAMDRFRRTPKFIDNHISIRMSDSSQS